MNTSGAATRGEVCQKHGEEHLFTSCVRRYKAVPGTVALGRASDFRMHSPTFAKRMGFSEKGKRLPPFAH
jgi:hypothetical protein